MVTTEIRVTAREIRPGDEIKFGPGPLLGARWEKVLRYSPTPESTTQITNRVGFTIAAPFTKNGSTYGYYADANSVHTVRRNTTDVPALWALVAA